MNHLREMLQSGRTAIGTHITLVDSTVTEIMGSFGFDYLWIDTEHTSFDLEDLRHHLIAAKSVGATPIVRVPEVSQVRAKPVLEMGPAGIVFPQVNSYEQALEAVAACRYPPKGNRGWGPRRAMGFGATLTTQEYIEQSDDVLTILQFENIAAYSDLDRILSIDGLDVIMLGPCDLASSMGHIGDWYHPEVERVVEDLFLRAHRAGKKIGVSFGMGTEEEMRRYQCLGVDMISFAAEVDFIVQGSRALYNKMHQIFQQPV